MYMATSLEDGVFTPLKRVKSLPQSEKEKNIPSMNINKIYSPFSVEGMMADWNFTWGPPMANSSPPTVETIERVQKTLPQCVVCLLPGHSSMVDGIFQGGHYLHLHCAVCEQCKTPVQGKRFVVERGKVYCESEFNQCLIPEAPGVLSPEVQASVDATMETLSVNIAVEPADYQIANYNVYPSPKLFLTSTLPISQTVTVTLVEAATNLELKEGFQSGHMRSLRSGGNCVHFTSLKLSKMGKIKVEMRQNNIKNFDKFLLRFTIGKRTFDSKSFLIKSACTQLPKELRDSVRPPKRPQPESSSLCMDVQELIGANSQIFASNSSNNVQIHISKSSP